MARGTKREKEDVVVWKVSCNLNFLPIKDALFLAKVLIGRPNDHLYWHVVHFHICLRILTRFFIINVIMICSNMEF